MPSVPLTLRGQHETHRIPPRRAEVEGTGRLPVRRRCHCRIDAARAHAATVAPPTRAAFHDAMRKLWEDHVTWTRLYIVSAAADLPDKDATTQRLLQNQTDIGNAVAGFYGKPAGDALTALLKSHILIAADLVAAS